MYLKSNQKNCGAKEKENSKFKRPLALRPYPIISRVNPEDKSGTGVPNTVQCYVQVSFCQLLRRHRCEAVLDSTFHLDNIGGIEMEDVLHGQPRLFHKTPASPHRDGKTWENSVGPSVRETDKK